MSKLKVSAIHDPDNDNEAITVDTSGNVGISQTASFDGNVGIGTSSPTAELHIKGAQAANVYDSQLLVDTTDTTGTIDYGSKISFGYHDGLVGRVGPYILGAKENSSAGSYSAYMSFATRPGGNNPTERMRIDSEGRVTMPYQPSASYTWDTHNFTGVFPAEDILHNTGGHLASNGRFTCPVDGHYLVLASWMNAGSTTTRVRILLNGGTGLGEHAQGVSYNTPTSYDRGQLMNILYLQANDYLEVSSQSGAIHQHHGNVVFRLIG